VSDGNISPLSTCRLQLAVDLILHWTTVLSTSMSWMSENCENGQFQFVSSTSMHIIKGIMLVLQENISILSGQIFDIRPSSASRDFQT